MKPKKSLCTVCQGKLKRKLLNVIIWKEDDWCQVDDRRCSVCKVRLSRYPLPINPRRSWPGSSTNLYNPLIPHFSGSWPGPVQRSSLQSPLSPTVHHLSSGQSRNSVSASHGSLLIIIIRITFPFQTLGISDIMHGGFEAMEMSCKCSNVVPPPG